MLRVIGDVHGCIDYCRDGAYDPNVRKEGRTYVSITQGAEYSLQVGDMGFSDSYERLKEWRINPDKHKFIQGNHDDYDNYPPHALADFGLAVHGNVPFAYIRGEKSVDWQWRIARQNMGAQQTWWPQEEFTAEQADQCIDFFSQLGQVDLMIAHGCPHKLFEHGILTNRDKLEPSFQSKLLTTIHEIVKPKVYIFGHHHQNWRKTVDGTDFICLNELCWLDIDDNSNIGETH